MKLADVENELKLAADQSTHTGINTASMKTGTFCLKFVNKSICRM
jgi:hypothetical protein